MKLKPLAIVALLGIWIAWCFLVIEFVVPAVQRHVTMWTQLIAVLFCILPVILAAGIAAYRARTTDSD